jgi:hypothetical protein
MALVFLTGDTGDDPTWSWVGPVYVNPDQVTFVVEAFPAQDPPRTHVYLGDRKAPLFVRGTVGEIVEALNAGYRR